MVLNQGHGYISRHNLRKFRLTTALVTRADEGVVTELPIRVGFEFGFGNGLKMSLEDVQRSQA